MSERVITTRMESRIGDAMTFDPTITPQRSTMACTGTMWIRRAVFILLGSSHVLVSSGLRAGQVPPIQSPHQGYGVHFWTTLDGLPQNTINAITQTKDGYLWLATFGGLARFDGIDFRVLDVATADGLASNRIMSLYEDREGTLWIGHERLGVTRYTDGVFTSYPPGDGNPDGIVWGFAEDRDGNVWVGSQDGGLHRFANGGFVQYTVEHGLPSNQVRTIYTDRDGVLWVGTPSGLGRSSHDRFTTYTSQDGLPDANVVILFEDHDGNLWVGTSRGLARWDGRRFSALEKANPAIPPLRGVAEDAGSGFWLATDRGLFHLPNPRDDPVARAVTRYQPVPAELTRSVFVDREGSIWAGTNVHGLTRITPRPLTRLTTEHGLLDRSVTSVVGDGRGGVWVGANCRPLARYQNGTITPYSLAVRGAADPCVQSLFKDDADTLWIGSNQGVLRFANGRVTRHATGLPSPRARIRSTYRDRHGVIWLGTEGQGIVRLDPDAPKRYTTRDGLVSDDVRFIFEDRRGTLWFGTGGGVSRLSQGEFINYTVADGLSPGMVRAIHEDADGTFWIGTYGGGLSRLKDGAITRITTANGLFENAVSSILEDRHGNLWMLGNLGVSFVSRNALNEFADGRRSNVVPVAFDPTDGMAEGNGGTQYAAWRTEDGKMWFATIDGLAMIDADDLSVNDLPPPVVIEQIRVDGQTMDGNQAVVAPPGDGDLEIQYTGLSLIAPEKVRFDYRLDGYDEDWIHAGNRRTAFYTNISPGTYTFRVRAANNAGVWNETGDAVSISLEPFLYETPWFYGLSGVLVTLLGVSGFRVRTRNMRERNKRLRQEIGEREKAEVALRLAEGRYRSLFHDAPLMYVTCKNMDGEGVVWDCNASFLQNLGYQREEVIQRPLGEFYSQESYVKLRDAGGFRRALEGNFLVEERQLVTKNGQVIDTVLHAVQEFGPDGTIWGTRAMYVDVTEQKRIEQEREGLIEELERRNAELERFTYTVSHDLRTPLVTIKGFLGLVERDVEKGAHEALRHDLEQIGTAAASMDDLLSQLLDLARVGHVVGPPEHLALSALARQAATLLEKQRDDVTVVIAPDLPTVTGDRTRLLEVLQNLLENAYRFMHDQPNPRIEIGAVRRGDETAIFVKDNGIGIDPKYQQQIFGLFQRLDASTEGSGIGLALAKRIIEVHKGRIWVESEGIGHGSTFYFTLPAVSSPTLPTSITTD